MKTSSSLKEVDKSELPQVDNDAHSFSARILLQDSTSTINSLPKFYNWIKSVEVESNASNDPSLGKLLINGFDNEQIWQQIETHNRFNYRRLKKYSSEYFFEESEFITRTDEKEVEINSQQDDAIDKLIVNDNSDDYGNFPEEMNEFNESTAPSFPKSCVDDKFFRLGEMEAFLEQEDIKELQSQSKQTESLLLLNDENDIEGADYKYEDFFGPLPDDTSKSTVSNGIQQIPEDHSATFPEPGRILFGSTDEIESKSTFELRQERLGRKIGIFEEENLKPKTWKMAGEIGADLREENELLEEHLHFEHATKTTPVITQSMTEKLEGIIEQRIKDKSYDDVERKIKSKSEPYVYRNDLILDQDKPKQSLAQVYEQEYLKKTEKAELEQKNAKHEEIRMLMRQLFNKLDALSSFHFSPKTLRSEVHVINNMPSLTLEEVAPTVVSDAALLAPEEIKTGSKGELKGTDERTTTDRLRERRRKKNLAKVKADRKRKIDRKEQFTELNKVAKLKRVKNDGKKVKSTAFFEKLQAQVEKVKDHSIMALKKERKSAAKFKL